MATPKQPWPDWASGYYILFWQQSDFLEGKLLWLMKHAVYKNLNVAWLEYWLPKLELVARNINLNAVRLERKRDSERWPRWALWALMDTTQCSKAVIRKLAQAQNHLELNNYILMERRVEEAQISVRKMLISLADGPAVEPSNRDKEFFVREAEEIVLRMLERENG